MGSSPGSFLLRLELFVGVIKGRIGGSDGQVGEVGGGLAHIQLALHDVGGQARRVFLHQRDFALGAGDARGERPLC